MMTRLSLTLIIALLSLCPCMASNGYDFDNIYNRFRNIDSKTLSELGGEFINRQSTDSAMAIFTILASRYDGRDVDLAEKRYAIEARLSLGVLNFLNANYASAYSNFLTASQLEGRPDSPGNLNLAAIYLYYGDRVRAYRCLRRVFDSAIGSNNYYMTSASLINLLTSDIDQSIMPNDTIRHIIELFREKVPNTPDDKAWPLAHCYSEAKIYSLDGHDDKAVTMLKASLNSAQRLLLPIREYFASYSALGKRYLSMERIDSAEFYMRKAEKIAENNAFPELLITAYSDLSNFYSATGRKDLADKYRFKHLELHDSVFNAREFGNIHDLELFHETDKFEKRINRIRVEEKMRVRIIFITTSALILLIGMLVILLFQNNKLRMKNRSLFDRNVEIMSSVKAENTPPDNTEKKYRTPVPDDETRCHISECIRKAMNDEAVFCMDGFSMRELSEICGSNQKYVSQVFNEDYGKSFTQLLNERRINVARQRLMDSANYGHLTIEAIVSDLGFKSRSTFSKTFKRLTGLTPSEFQRIAYEASEEQKNS